MIFLRSLVLLLAAATCGFAADQTAANASPLASPGQTAVAPWFSGMKQVSPVVKFANPSYRFKPGRHIPVSSFAALRGDVCLTMRSYKVKRTERWSDDEFGRPRYSTCEMARNYDIRNSDGKPALLIPTQ
jgi:hypothetical protein